MKHIGLFSGTFDPIHIGHVEACLVALGMCELNEVLVMIEKSPKRKQKVVTSYKDRRAMVKLALKDFHQIKFFDHQADNITFENTLPELQKKFSDPTICMIFGSDMLEHLQQWPQAKIWLAKIELCVVLRDNKDRKKTEQQLEKVACKSYKILPAVWSPVSSSSVKQQLAHDGHSDLIHREVKKYIARHRLYSIKPSSRKLG